MTTKLYLGLPGTGKTLALQDSAREILRSGKVTVVTVDRAGEWLPNSPRWRKRRNGSSAAPETLIAGKDAPDFDEARGKLVVFGYGWEAEDAAQWTRSFDGNAVFIDDELDISLPNTPQPRGAALIDFINRGRHLPDINGVPREKHLWGAARRPENIHKDATGNATEVFLFRMTSALSLNKIRLQGWIENPLILRREPDLYYWHWKATDADPPQRWQVKPLDSKEEP